MVVTYTAHSVLCANGRRIEKLPEFDTGILSVNLRCREGRIVGHKMILCKCRGTWLPVRRQLQGTCEREQRRPAPEANQPAWARRQGLEEAGSLTVA